ncbi:hypothetical protein EDEG_03122 [Edhazardia aedis USNM 41457]|uniref:Uncharacterized protein n=1 Tax=Edhazardia aedis (strain USNM 41457) TaxID=1003232 RepID=J9D4G6_EDHAE|nr:hypothetical protein EDEG_03122 [Edhazardia aedis USNM 41457]|eukprot:EJW02449.1 hypothetical protein EDEG_03122 [Edhazardia aedis USNM 41457]
MYEFLIRKIKVIRSKLTDFCILESLYPLHYQEIKHFMDLLDERCNLQAKEEDKEENSTNLRENNKIENTKMKKTADHKQLPEFNQSDSLESKNLNSKNKNGKKNKKNLKKDNFSSKNNFQAQKKEKIIKKLYSMYFCRII